MLEDQISNDLDNQKNTTRIENKIYDEYTMNRITIVR
jgi:hypothetical protein